MTITDFLLARITEDEETARAATTRAGSTIYTDARRGGKQAVLDHVMRHAPARVLAECEAKRQIIDLHQRCNVHDRPCDECDACQRCGDGSIWPCDTLLAVASVYADHPDHRAEWDLT